MALALMQVEASNSEPPRAYSTKNSEVKIRIKIQFFVLSLYYFLKKLMIAVVDLFNFYFLKCSEFVVNLFYLLDGDSRSY